MVSELQWANRRCADYQSGARRIGRPLLPDPNGRLHGRPADAGFQDFSRAKADAIAVDDAGCGDGR